MATVEVSGLPNKSKLQKLVFIFKNTLKKSGSSPNFWIKEMSDIRGTDLTYVTLEFPSYKEAYRAMKVLDGFIYYGDKEMREVYPLKARMDEESRPMRSRRRSPSPYRHRSRGRDDYEDFMYDERRRSRQRSRSRSLISREASKLDIEIEMLRKRRLIIEEERRLLLERKKLELLKEFGPSALKEFKFLGEEREVERDRRQRRVRSPVYRTRRPSPPRSTNKWDPSKLPPFIYPCKILLGEMKEPLEKLGTQKENILLLRVTRNNIRKRLAVLLADKPIMPGVKVVQLYREKYPQTQDEEFIKNNLNEARSSHMYLDKDDIGAEKENAKSPKVKEENNEAKDNENTDAAKPDYGEIVVKIEPDDADKPISTEEPITKKPVSIKKVNEGENPEPKEVKEDAGSITSSDALTLHDKNDEDWAEGVHSWTDEFPAPTE